MNTAVRDVMTTRVVSVSQDASFREMASGLRENRVSAFPVLDGDGKVIGVVTLRIPDKQELAFCIPVEALRAAARKVFAQSKDEAHGCMAPLPMG